MGICRIWALLSYCWALLSHCWVLAEHCWAITEHYLALAEPLLSQVLLNWVLLSHYWEFWYSVKHWWAIVSHYSVIAENCYLISILVWQHRSERYYKEITLFYDNKIKPTIIFKTPYGWDKSGITIKGIRAMNDCEGWMELTQPNITYLKGRARSKSIGNISLCTYLSCG